MHLDGRIDLIALEYTEFIADYQAPYLYGLVSFLLLVSPDNLGFRRHSRIQTHYLRT